ncbi:MAG: FHA domain-containing serine/threonine-protein kinase [Planctomycetaceae bacterium]
MYLKVLVGQHKGLVVEVVPHQSLIAGRSRQAQLSLPDESYLSRNHFRVEYQPPVLQLVDLNSRNGTFLNGKRVTTCRLCDGDVISVGKTEIRVSMPGEERKGVPEAFDKTYVPTVREFAAASLKEELNLPGLQLQDVLGQGAMGIVFRALELGTGRTVAVKAFKIHRDADSLGTQLFLREASILGQLAHPRIVAFEQLGMHQGRLYLVMEYIDRVPSLDVLNAADGQRSMRVCCGMMSEVLEGLHFAHSRGIVHRDVKPSNFLMYRNGRRLHVKLADFGLAKNFHQAGLSGITTEGDVRGSFGYMPPEQIRDSLTATPSCDIYAAASSLYSLLARQLPYPLESLTDIMLAKLETDPQPLIELRPDLPKELCSLIHAALSREPDGRPATSLEFQQRLAPFVKRAGK